MSSFKREVLWGFFPSPDSKLEEEDEEDDDGDDGGEGGLSTLPLPLSFFYVFEEEVASLAFLSS